jgi:hypothetical protein
MLEGEGSAMSPTLCTFQLAYDLHPVEVNVDNVRYVEGKDLTTAIHLDDHKCIVVLGSALSVSMRMQEAKDQARSLRKRPHDRQKRLA